MPDETTTTEETSLLEGQNAEEKSGGQEVAGNEAPPKESGTSKESEGEGKKEEGEAPQPLTAEAIKLPEGLEVSDAMMEKFLGVMNDQTMDPVTRAQALVDLQAEAAKEASEKNAELWRDTQEQWVNEVRNDKDIGGEKFQSTIDRVSKLVDQYGSEELRDVFALTGAGNNVHVIKFLNKIAAVLTEGGPVAGSPGSQARTAAEILYPNAGKE